MELLTIDDLAEFFSVKSNTVKSWLQRKIIPQDAIFKVGMGKRGGTIRFIKSKVEDWVNGGLQT